MSINDSEMSRQHFRIDPTPDGFFSARDVGSTNGVFVNGSKEEEVILVAGMEIRAGNTSFLFTGS